MPYIFRFHKGTNNNIYDWKASDRITAADLQDINDKTNILSSSAGTSIPTPLARLFLFKTAFEIVAAQVRKNTVDKDSIYAGLVSDALDLLELLYKSGADVKRFEYRRWTFENNDDYTVHFGDRPGHKLLSQSFKQAAGQSPFYGRIEITLIYYKEGTKKVLIGGTSPFTFVFTSPNFKRKMKERGFKTIRGMVSEDVLFDSKYLQLQERDTAFIKYVQKLTNTPGIGSSFNGISDYVANTARRYEGKFNGSLPALSDIRFNDTPVMAGSIHLKQVSEDDFRQNINDNSDFKIALADDTNYTHALIPLFLMHKMVLEGQYSSASNTWSSATEISQMEYPEDTIEEIMMGRELPGLTGIKYPFFSSFDFFEAALVKLPGYALNDERFVTMIDNQAFLYPIKSLFFHLFPVHRIKEYVLVERGENEIKFTIKVPVYGPTKGSRILTCSKTYKADTMIDYEGILGIFPFTRTSDPSLLFTNQYTIASYEKTNAGSFLESIAFYKKNAIETNPAAPVQRSNYKDINTKTTYYQVNKSFDIIQLNFKKNGVKMGGVLLPIFKEVQNGEAEYIYAIDFGTSNTHVEFGMVVDGRVKQSSPFSIEENKMQMYLLNKPNRIESNDSESYLDFERSTGYKIDKARQVTLREFVPFQIGSQKGASVQFPFRTATCESNSFINNPANNRIFIDANIGFNIDEDVMTDNATYKTDLKWLLQKDITEPFNINRVTLFAKELMLMIRTKALLEEAHADLKKLKVILAFPLSMGDTLKNELISIFEAQRVEVFGLLASPMTDYVTESIAPYYELKSKNINIQNDNFCNIDIGGGTTDIVLTKTETINSNNLLQCYCSSFRFAGSQLWSSGVAEYNSSDNGFVAYYKKFITKARIDTENSGNLERVLNGNNIKTEDIVGLLFSNPAYKFSDIFLEKPDFRVVPLIHYAAILYYIAKLSEWKDIQLPRTVSFSGKGSEYINLLFPATHNNNNADLKGFTQKLLTLFSGKAIRPDFMIEKNKEPKVITARGAVHYAVENIKDDAGDDWGNSTDPKQDTKEKKLVKNNVIYKGFKTLAFEDRSLSYADLADSDELYRDVIANHIEFFNKLFDNTGLVDVINKKLEITDFHKYKRFFIPESGDIYTTGVLRDSFKATLKNVNLADKVDDSPFFFALNYALIELSRAIFKTAQI